MWRAGWLLTNLGHLELLNHSMEEAQVSPVRTNHFYLSNVLAIKAPVITRSFLWRSGWLLTNQGQLSWIDDLIVQWKRHNYHHWWQRVALWVTVLAIKAPVITGSRSLPTVIVPCSTFMATNNTLWTWHDKCNISLWWCFVLVIFFVDGHKKVRVNCLARQIQSCLISSSRNKIYYELFVSI